MATNNCILSFYTLSLKLKLVVTIYSMGMKFLPKLFTTKEDFQFLIATSGVELCGDKPKLS